MLQAHNEDSAKRHNLSNPVGLRYVPAWTGNPVQADRHSYSTIKVATMPCSAWPGIVQSTW